ncbi:MAG: DNA mismatch endonuclease Vsr [Proteobacteria bacterium]|nr:DNA mismatch endonuclease Vsr [Pseudomonadota bacterium]
MDKLSPERRSENMRRIKSKGMKPEMVVRRTVHALGYRYRLHRKDLPGKPDLVFGPRRKVIFVHGCFWHGHDCKEGNRRPKSNIDYWHAKISNNHLRDFAQQQLLQGMGWSVLVIWECESEPGIRQRLVEFLG